MGMTLAEAKAERDGVAAAVRLHKVNCERCGSTKRGRARPAPCDQGRALKDQHSAAVKQVKEWFAPGPDQGMLT
jgi:hypothetical protein